MRGQPWIGGDGRLGGISFCCTVAQCSREGYPRVGCLQMVLDSTKKKAITRDAVLSLYPADPLEGSGRVVVVLLMV